MDRHRNNRQIFAPEHHHGVGRPASIRRKMRQIFRMAGMPETGGVKNAFGNGIGDQRGRMSFAHRSDGAIDRLDSPRSRGRIRMSGYHDRGLLKRNDGQGLFEKRLCLMPGAANDGHIKAQPS